VWKEETVPREKPADIASRLQLSLVIGACAATAVVSAYFVAGHTTARRAARAEALTSIVTEHAAVCAKLGHQAGQPQYALCMSELDRLWEIHEQGLAQQAWGLL
jgi:hypothetical protein